MIDSQHITTTAGNSTKLFGIFIDGSDDLLPAPSEQEAIAACMLINSAAERLNINVNGKKINATTIEWEFGSEWHRNDKQLFYDLLGCPPEHAF